MHLPHPLRLWLLRRRLRQLLPFRRCPRHRLFLQLRTRLRLRQFRQHPPFPLPPPLVRFHRPPPRQ